MSTSEGVVRGRDDRGTRKSRFHTARGPMPASAWLRMPETVLRRRLGRVPERPWIVPAAVGWLSRRLRPDWSVLELGSGRSTAWLAARVGQLLSFEDDEYWRDRAVETLIERGLANAEVRRLPVEQFVSALAALPDDSFDLIVVDFLESPQAERPQAVAAARAKVRLGGYLLLDDSDRPAYAGAEKLLAGWKLHRWVGIKDEYPLACETSIYRRPEK